MTDLVFACLLLVELVISKNSHYGEWLGLNCLGKDFYDRTEAIVIC